MTDVIYYVALPFIATDDDFMPGEAVECTSANAAIIRSEALSRKQGYTGAIAFSRTGDPSIGEFADAVVLKTFGEVPSDLSSLK